MLRTPSSFFAQNNLHRMINSLSNSMFFSGSKNVRYKSSTKQHPEKRVLITGGLGQLGIDLAKEMRIRYGEANILLTDIKMPSTETRQLVRFEYLNVLDVNQLENMVVNNGINLLVHFSAILSALAEKEVKKSLDINIDGFHNVLEVCRKHNIQLYCPSSIAAFGSSAPRNPTPDITIQRPRTVYGVSKVHMELMGELYSKKYGLDFRSLRYPGIISDDTIPAGGTTDYATEIFHILAQRQPYNCFLKESTMLPMMFIKDCIRGTIQFIEAPKKNLTLQTYNVAAISFTPLQLVTAMLPYFPNIDITYDFDPIRQSIADTWPQVLDDTNARKDWGWKHEYKLEDLVKLMYNKVKTVYNL